MQLGGKTEKLKLACAGIAIVLTMLPFAFARHLPFVDFPNHIARYYIHQNLEADPYLAMFYQWHWVVIPNLAVDVLILPLLQFLPVEPAANLVIMLALVTTYIGTIAIDRQLHGANWGISIFTGVLVYSGPLRMGFANFIVGVAFAVVLFALWLRFRSRLTPVLLVGFTAGTALLLLAHLYGFGIYAVCVGGSELARLMAEPRPFRIGSWRRRLILVGIALSLVLPIALLALGPSGADAGITRLSTLRWKAEAVLSPVFFNQPAIELPLLGVVAMTLAIGLFGGLMRISQPMRPALLIFVVMLLVMPRTLYGSNYADYRLLGGIDFLFIGSLELTPRSRDWRKILVGVATVALAVRIGSILTDWILVQPILAEYDTALQAVPPGSKMLVLQGSLGSTSADRRPPLQHVPVWAATRRGIFVGYIFVNQAIITLAMRPAVQDLEHFAPYPSFSSGMAKYDYLMTLYQPRFDIPPGLTLQPVAHGTSYTISKIVK